MSTIVMTTNNINNTNNTNTNTNTNANTADSTNSINLKDIQTKFEHPKMFFKKSNLNFDCEDWGNFEDEDEILYESHQYDYFENPNDYGEYDEQYDNIQGLTKCRNCGVFHFLKNTRCQFNIERKVIECICCRYELQETEFPFVENEEQIEKEGEEIQRENVCSQCQPHKNKSHCCLMVYCDCAHQDISNNDDDDYFCHDCDRPHYRCMCDYWAERCEEEELNGSYHDNICDDCGYKLCHCYDKYQY